jgi:hypothetical protein
MRAFERVPVVLAAPLLAPSPLRIACTGSWTLMRAGTAQSSHIAHRFPVVPFGDEWRIRDHASLFLVLDDEGWISGAAPCTAPCAMSTPMAERSTAAKPNDVPYACRRGTLSCGTAMCPGMIEAQPTD